MSLSSITLYQTLYIFKDQTAAAICLSSFEIGRYLLTRLSPGGRIEQQAVRDLFGKGGGQVHVRKPGPRRGLQNPTGVCHRLSIFLFNVFKE